MPFTTPSHDCHVQLHRKIWRLALQMAADGELDLIRCITSLSASLGDCVKQQAGLPSLEQITSLVRDFAFCLAWVTAINLTLGNRSGIYRSVCLLVLFMFLTNQCLKLLVPLVLPQCLKIWKVNPEISL